MALHVVGRASHQQPCLRGLSAEGNGDAVGIIVEQRGVDDVPALARGAEGDASHRELSILDHRAEHAVVDVGLVVRMAPLANALQRNLQRGIGRTGRTILLVEDVGHVGIEELVDALGLVHVLHLNDLVQCLCTLDVAILSLAHVQPQHHLQGLAESLVDDEAQRTVLARELIVDIGRVDAATVPVLRESRAQDALPVERLRNDAKEALQQRSGRDAYAVAKVAIALATRSIVVAHLSEVGRRLSVVHLV